MCIRCVGTSFCTTLVFAQHWSRNHDILGIREDDCKSIALHDAANLRRDFAEDFPEIEVGYDAIGHSSSS